jgi:amino acid transporter
MSGIVAWCAALGACLVVEGVALLRPELGWPTLSDVARVVTSSVVGRVLLFALWLWLGWHLFVRGWRFLLYAPAGSEGHGSSPEAVASAEAVATLVAACLVGLVLVTVARRRERSRTSEPRAEASPRDRLKGLLGTAAGGYVAFLALVAIYDAFTAEPDALVHDALLGGGLLALGAVLAAGLVVALSGRGARRS